MKLLDFLPRRCLCCGAPAPDSALCRPCQSRFQNRSSYPGVLGPCPVCGQGRLAEAGPCVDCRDRRWSFPTLDGLFGYQDAGGELLRLYKFGGLSGLAHHWAGAAVGRLVPPGPLVAVPPHPKHLLHRGWDPVQTFVRALGQRSGLPVWPALRRLPSASQKALDRGGRLENARLSYSLVPGYRRPLASASVVWLVDDVVTTGATVEACSRLLRDAGAPEVRVFCLGLH